MLLEVINLSHIFSDGTCGLKDINFFIKKGELVCLAGKNGSGKTVLMKHLNGLLTPTEGEVLLKGASIRENLSETRRTIGLVFQNPEYQFIGQTVEEDVAFGPENLGLDRAEIEQRTEKALKSVNLPGVRKRSPHSLSGGEKRRLSIAGILAMDPEIIVMDEPFTGLDLPGVRQILSCVRSLNEKGHTLIIITHDIGKVFSITDRCIILDKGQVKYSGPPGDIAPKVWDFGIRGYEDYEEEGKIWLS